MSSEGMGLSHALLHEQWMMSVCGILRNEGWTMEVNRPKCGACMDIWRNEWPK